MPIDPFRIQLLTLALDSRVVLTLVGFVVAGFTFRQAAQVGGLPHLTASTWWDIVTAAIVGARGLWVLTHWEYYLRGPLQVLVLTDGGLHPVGLVIGAAYAVWRLTRAERATGAGRTILAVVAVATLVAAVLERTGCALTTCGDGSLTNVGWALQRGDALRHPVALYQVGILAGALVLATEVRRLARYAFPVALAGFALSEVVGFVWGNQGAEGITALLAAGILALAAGYTSTQRGAWRRAVNLPVSRPGTGAG